MVGKAARSRSFREDKRNNWHASVERRKSELRLRTALMIRWPLAHPESILSIDTKFDISMPASKNLYTKGVKLSGYGHWCVSLIWIYQVFFHSEWEFHKTVSDCSRMLMSCLSAGSLKHPRGYQLYCSSVCPCRNQSYIPSLVHFVPSALLQPGYPGLCFCTFSEQSHSRWRHQLLSGPDFDRALSGRCSPRHEDRLQSKEESTVDKWDGAVENGQFTVVRR